MRVWFVSRFSRQLSKRLNTLKVMQSLSDYFLIRIDTLSNKKDAKHATNHVAVVPHLSFVPLVCYAE